MQHYGKVCASCIISHCIEGYVIDRRRSLCATPTLMLEN